MMKVFLDTNVIIDFVDNRVKRAYAKQILELGEQGEVSLFVSYLTIANMAYILRHRSKKEMYEKLRQTRELFTVVAPTIRDLDYALTHEVKDFEDMLQYLCALDADCDIIVTNNPKDYREFSQLPFFTSEEFVYNYLKEYRKN